MKYGVQCSVSLCCQVALRRVDMTMGYSVLFHCDVKLCFHVSV
jgi:hypothetical protein